MRSPILLSLLLGLSASVGVTAIPHFPLLAAETPPTHQRVVQSQRSLRPVVMTLERTVCFGTCPIYKITIYGNGKVVYEGIRFVKETGTRTTTISQAAVRNLVAEFERIRYFNLKDSYTGGHTDAPTVITSLTLGKRQKTIHDYLGSPNAPAQLRALEQKIDAVVNSKQWIGSGTERSPGGTR